MSRIVKNQGSRGGHYLEIDGEKVLYMPPETVGKNYSALVKLKEAGEDFSHEGKTEIKIGSTKLKVYDDGWFSRSLKVSLHSAEYPESVQSTYKIIDLSKLPDVIQTLGDFIDEETMKMASDEQRRIFGNRIK